MRCLMVLGMLFLFLPAWCVAGSEATLIWDAHHQKIVHVEVIGKLANGTSELVQAASGFRVAQPYVVTNAHLFSSIGNYDSVQINVRLESRNTNPYSAHLEITDTDVDVALLKVDGLPVEAGCPYFLVTDSNAVRPGADLFFLGFPIDDVLRISVGILSINADPTLALWQTDANLNVGNSGGPGFTSGGYLVGIVKGAVTGFQVGEQTSNVQGIAQFVPSIRFQQSQVGKRVLEEQEDVRCLRAVAMNADGSFGLGSDPLAPIDKPTPLTLALPVALNWKDGSPLPTPRKFSASDNYRITRCKFEGVSVEGAEVWCTASESGTYATLDLKPVGAQEPGKARRVVGRVVLDQIPTAMGSVARLQSPVAK
ncbi:serine protease [Pseudomonas wadenswilerensis]|uniref:Uncharacterized protein n=3 Tax=Pseudomonas TaxID=286 RepID=A0A5E6PN51_PSEFL|nr:MULTISPECIES: serine protease [Pseudomonas]SUQ63265.1 Serine protease [Pseudomonas wadenswilerensis]VVM45026.1 hypothetical protein PS652_00473 [Pseudomonas fluorescens]